MSDENQNGCNKCDDFGGVKTYEHQALIPINGRVRGIDWCIHHIVAALNAGGVETVASCCGHGMINGSIVLKDGRELVVRDYQENNDFSIKEINRLIVDNKKNQE